MADLQFSDMWASWVIRTSYDSLANSLPMLPCDIISFSKKITISCQGFLDIIGIFSLFCSTPFRHGKYADDMCFLGWVWYMMLTHTQLLKEMSAGLCCWWWQSPRRVSPKRSGEINEFLKEAFSTALAAVCPTSHENRLNFLSSNHALLSFLHLSFHLFLILSLSLFSLTFLSHHSHWLHFLPLHSHLNF